MRKPPVSHHSSREPSSGPGGSGGIAGGVDGAVGRVLAALREARPLRVVGAVGGYRGYLLAQAALDPRAEGPVFTVAADDAAARALAIDATFFMGAGQREVGVEGPVLVVPEIDVSPYADTGADPRAVALRLAALHRLVDAHSDPPRLVVASVRSLLRRVIAPAALLGLCTRWSRGDLIERDDAIATLERAGYLRVDVVEDPGSYAVRGGVIDVYVASLRFPVRIELDDVEIERMRPVRPGHAAQPAADRSLPDPPGARDGGDDRGAAAAAGAGAGRRDRGAVQQEPAGDRGPRGRGVVLRPGGPDAAVPRGDGAAVGLPAGRGALVHR
ncbi:hypothetical protein [Nannocystis sp.]|uniref:hypothetical protein n=1 Tax=Nannocystis sp. TaxID=1962667 RepID=UPI0025D8B842|nr:hypothetical protein [Nannocystis sp.]MBK7825863.1 hypothetical protein [Nannocystis sp.]